MIKQCEDCQLIKIQEGIIKDQREAIKKLTLQNKKLQHGHRLKFITPKTFDFKLN